MDEILDNFRDDNENDEIKDWRNYLGEHADYYIPIWEKIQSGQIVIFNIYAFFFGIFWMFFRKMYRVSFVIGIISIVQVILEEMLRINWRMTENEFRPFTWSSYLISWTIMGMFGNYFFYWDTQKKIATLRNSTIENYDIKLRESGGTSWLSLAIGIVIYSGALLMGFILLEMYYTFS